MIDVVASIDDLQKWTSLKTVDWYRVGLFLIHKKITPEKIIAANNHQHDRISGSSHILRNWFEQESKPTYSKLIAALHKAGENVAAGKLAEELLFQAFRSDDTVAVQRLLQKFKLDPDMHTRVSPTGKEFIVCCVDEFLFSL